jgi:hypothetical protein
MALVSTDRAEPAVVDGSPHALRQTLADAADPGIDSPDLMLPSRRPGNRDHDRRRRHAVSRFRNFSD